MKTVNLFNGDCSDPAVLLVCYIEGSGSLIIGDTLWPVELRFPQWAICISVFTGSAGKSAYHAFRCYFPDAVIHYICQVEVIVLVKGALLRVIKTGICANAITMGMLASASGKMHRGIQCAGFPVVLGPQYIALVHYNDVSKIAAGCKLDIELPVHIIHAVH